MEKFVAAGRVIFAHPACPQQWAEKIRKAVEAEDVDYGNPQAFAAKQAADAYFAQRVGRVASSQFHYERMQAQRPDVFWAHFLGVDFDPEEGTLLEHLVG